MEVVASVNLGTGVFSFVSNKTSGKNSTKGVEGSGRGALGRTVRDTHGFGDIPRPPPRKVGGRLNAATHKSRQDKGGRMYF